ncbi:uncharacterized protein LOC119727785 [Patiria miniata]|uniref:Uncharacterized protein n=1 Tax=Patiria miniata TaxID=46514 RepID=A0A913ZVT6_PATMI|nr:uncharacterized protein LOC119727785 [Patiria miniata]
MKRKGDSSSDCPKGKRKQNWSPYRTWESLKDRIDYLKRKYRDAKKENNASGRGRVSSPYYKELDEFLGKSPMTNCRAYHHADAGLSSDKEEDDEQNASTSQSDTTEQVQDYSDVINEDMDAIDEVLATDEQSTDGDTTAELEDPATDPGNSKAPSKLKEKFNGQMTRKRRGKKSQIKEAMGSAVSKLIEAQQAAKDETTMALLQMEKEHFQWEKARAEEKERREDQHRREQLAFRQQQGEQNRAFMLQLATILGNNRDQYTNIGGPSTDQAIPPYVNQNSFDFQPTPRF